MYCIGLHPSSVLLPIEKYGPIFLHEMGHLHHSNLCGEEFSVAWSKNVFFEAFPDESTIQYYIRKNKQRGFLTHYSYRCLQKETNEYKSKVEVGVDTTPSEVFEYCGTFEEIAGLEIAYIPSDVPEIISVVDVLREQILNLPPLMRRYIGDEDSLSKIFIDSKIRGFSGWFNSPIGIVDYHMFPHIKEDVAESTRILYGASLYPHSRQGHNYAKVINLLKYNPRVRRRLDLLLEYGFLSEETGDRLYSLVQ